MASGIRQGMAVAALMMSSFGAADARQSLAALPVSDMKVVATADYAEVAALAARAGGPLDIALAIVGAFEGVTQQIIQVNEGAEAPTASRVTVLRDGLLDDSVRGERWDIALEKSANGGWRIKEVKRAWRCWRGPQPERFSATPCR